ncbi:MAG: alpha/beta hydrolase [Chlorobaculum sp.]|nr:alpha/beta hydrolase [Chlorobaculum sp.]
MPTRSRYITLGGHRHRYIDTGGDSPVMLLLHGISSSLDYFGPSIPLLARSFRVLGLDLLGFGESDKPRTMPYSLHLYASLIHEFLRKTGAADGGKVYATGHSMGGKYLLATALLYPGSFTRMVLSNTDGFIILPSFARALSLPGVRHLLKPLVTGERVAAKMLDVAIHNRQAVDGHTWRKVLDIARARDAFETVMSLNRHMFKLDLQRTGLRARLGELTQPVLIIWGEQDRYISPKIAHIVQQELPNAKLLFFRECGHSPMLEYPERFSTAITEFVQQESLLL